MSVRPIGGGKYRVRVYNPHGPEYRKIVAGKRAADAHEAEMRLKMAAGRDPRAGRKLTFRSYADDQIAARALRPNTLANYRKMLDALIYPRIGDRPLAGLRHTDMVALQRHVFTTASPRRAAQAMVLVKSILRAAVLDGVLDANPAAAVTVPKPPAPDVAIPTWGQVRAAVAGARPDTAAMVAACALAGLRIGEVCGLAVDDVDWLRGVLSVRRQVQYLSAANDVEGVGGTFYAAPKTPESVRAVPIPPVLVELLSRAAGRRGGAATVLPWGSSSGPTQAHRLLFGGSNSVSASRRVAQAARRQFTAHALRHLYTTTLLEGGVPLQVVDAVTGHASRGMTMRYAHVTPAGLERVVPVVVAAWLGGEGTPTATTVSSG